MSAELDVDKLRNELQELSQQKQQVNERLRNWDSRGRGGGMGPSVPGPGFGPGPGRAMQQRLAEPSGGRGRDGFGSRAGFGSRDGPGYRDGPGARDGPGYRDGPGARDAPGFRNGNGLREPAFRPREPVAAAAPLPPGPPKKLMSAIVVNGQTRMLRQQSDGSAAAEPEQPAGLKRPAPSEAEQAPAAQKRARRMFGALMGTLAKASAEEVKFQQSGGAAKRQEAMQRVREREREERTRAREVARQKELAERQAEVVRKRELTAMADVKRLEIMTAERIVHRGVLANFLRTAAGPPLHWLPVAHTPATEALLKQQQADLADWKAKELQRLEEQRTSILAARAPQLLHPAGDGAAAKGDAEMTEAHEEGEAAQTDAEGAAAEEPAGAEAEGGTGERWEAGQATDTGGGDDRWQDEMEAAPHGVLGAASDADADEADAEAEMEEEEMEDDTRRGRGAAETLEDLLQ